MIKFINRQDYVILNLIQKYMRSSVMDSLMSAITALGDYGIIWIIVSAFFLFNKRRRKYGYLLLLSLLFSYILVEFVLKDAFGRLRPFIVNEEINLLIQAPGGFSFPSGHTCTAFAAAFVIAKAEKRLTIAGYLLAFAIAFSRIYLYVHHPSDILAGAILGTAISWLLCLIFRRFLTAETTL